MTVRIWWSVYDYHIWWSVYMSIIYDNHIWLSVYDYHIRHDLHDFVELHTGSYMTCKIIIYDCWYMSVRIWVSIWGFTYDLHIWPVFMSYMMHVYDCHIWYIHDRHIRSPYEMTAQIQFWTMRLASSSAPDDDRNIPRRPSLVVTTLAPSYTPGWVKKFSVFFFNFFKDFDAWIPRNNLECVLYFTQITRKLGFPAGLRQYKGQGDESVGLGAVCGACPELLRGKTVK